MTEPPSYIALHRRGELATRIEKALRVLESCTICPRSCRINRIEDEKSYCKVGRLAILASYHAHFGEENCLVGQNGSGTIFFSSCNLLCEFCQNFDISYEREGHLVEKEALAEIMVILQKNGCHNINFVTPTHVVAQILEALPLAIDKGLEIPLVYNSGGYDKVETLELLDGVFDIYMPDLKFMDTEPAKRFCNAPDYPEVAKKAIKEMHRQVGDLVVDKYGVAQRGLLVRHLVMPNGLAGTREAMRFLAKEISENTYVNIMPQYRPHGFASSHRDIARGITTQEYREAIGIAQEEGIERLDNRPSRLIWLL